jgi:UDP-N-acetylglucosamine diphosphorylase/glucosamine-1-phosphate N-acetyltransferase
MKNQLYLFDDLTAQSWEPLALTRPVGELLFGALLLRERAEAQWGVPCKGHLVSEELSGFSEIGAPPVLGLDGLPRGEGRILVNSRLVMTGLTPPLPEEVATLYLHGKVVGYSLPPGATVPGGPFPNEGRPIPDSQPVDLEGQLLGEPWDAMAKNADQLRTDIPRLFPGYATGELEGCHIIGDGLLTVGTDVSVEPGSVFDVQNGPIRLSDGVTVRALTRMEGPVYVGPGSTILGGSISEASIGPVCKIRGEVESTVILGYSNKAHDGFMGHAYLGRWVNLGAFTTNSDLKNNYGQVRVGGVTGPRGTGMMKVGCFLGDHVKTGIGTLLNTGTVVGAGSNLFGGRMPPPFVPAFSWGTGAGLTEFRLEKFLEVATKAMGRRGVELNADMVGLFSRAWETSRKLRKHGLDS